MKGKENINKFGELTPDCVKMKIWPHHIVAYGSMAPPCIFHVICCCLDVANGLLSVDEFQSQICY